MEKSFHRPAGVVHGVEQEELSEIITFLRKWKPNSDVFAIKYYPFALSALSVGSAAFINAHYRKAVKLRNSGFLTSLLPVIMLPSIASSLMHHQLVQGPFLLQKVQCPLCIELRGGMVQLFCGFIYPMVLAPLAAFQLATRLYTYPLPSVFKPKAWLKEYIKLSRPIQHKVYLLAGIQIAAGMAWTHWEAQNLFTVISKLSDMEEVLRVHYEEKTNQPSNF
ncbi:transmembrane protein 126A isoform X1 [Panulirus ornatus]|uniref:transmembrane protein 126A isoform X1 n=1 Tax=Panulirus ornatus TaxID=150431 RepID=UPI003A83D58B